MSLWRVWWCDHWPPDLERRNALMETEIAAMKAAFRKGKRVPVNTRVRWDVDFFLETIDLKLNVNNPHEVYWLIIFRMHRDPRAGRQVDFYSDQTFGLKIVYNAEHPHKEPAVYPYRVDRRTGDMELLVAGRGSHQYDSGQLCLWDHTASAAHGWDPATSIAATFALWAVEWIRAYLRAQKTGDFPETA